jgi:pimeloyl-ACP methyl ester carboxylesterase
VGLERAALLGNSFGCQVIADLAVRYPQRVTHAILQGPTTPPQERSVFWQFVRWRQIVVDIVYRGTNPNHGFSLQWGRCYDVGGPPLGAAARLVDEQWDRRMPLKARCY